MLEFLRSKVSERKLRLFVILDFLRGKVSDRKLRLFVIAHVRRVWGDYKSSATHEAWRAIEVAERYADKVASYKELQAAHHAVLVTPESDDLSIHFLNTSAGAATSAKVGKAFADATASDYAARITPHASPIIDADRAERCRLVRDIFGNPFRPVTVAASSRSGPVLNLAKAIYANRAFDRLPELANVLEQAGCANQEILDHCRQPGPHVRGCWVVDLVLGKQ
jgi:hypothetical protein